MPSPIVVSTCQAAVLSAASNVLAQLTRSYLENTPFILNLAELFRFVIITFITAPPNYRWQQLLERTFPAYAPSDSNPESNALPMTRLDAEKRGHEINDRDYDQVADDVEIKPKLNFTNTFMKWFIDTMTMGALVNTSIFLALMGFLKGQSVSQIAHTVRRQTMPLILASYKVWPFVSVINFSFVPVERRIVFMSTVGLLWGVYISMIASKI